jgi:hypothetical protein
MGSLILGVTCANASYEDAASSFKVLVTDELRTRITELANVVSACGANSVIESNQEGVWAVHDTDELATVSEEDIFDVEVSGRELTVTRDSFGFSATPKHCNEDLKMTTELIALADLDNLLEMQNK